MQQARQRRLDPELRAMLVEASMALARLDADRLEELAVSCQALNRGLPADGAKRLELGRQALQASAEMAVFGRMLEATRANLDVMNRLRQRHEAPLEYGVCGADAGSSGRAKWTRRESSNGNH